MLRTIELSRDKYAPGAAREAVTGFCAEHNPQLTNTARLLVSELVTNSVLYGEGEHIRLLVELARDGGMRCEVINEGEVFTHVPRAADRVEPGGWGLELVERLSVDWGVDDGSTHVWFVLAADATAAPAA